MKDDRDFLRQVRFWYVLDRVFAWVTPVFAALVLLWLLAQIFLKAGVR